MKKRVKLIACIMAAAVFAAGCGAGGGSASSSAAMAPSADMAAGNFYTEGKASEEYGYEYAEAPAEAETADMDENRAATEEPVDPPEPGGNEIDPKALEEKLVYTCDISIETLEFENSATALRNSIKQFGGIISSESTWDNDYRWYYNDYGKTSGTLTLSMTVRVPSGKYQEFLASLEGVGGKVRNRSMNVRNITKTYNDQSVLIQSLETQEKRLNEMMDKAETIEDMITVEARLTDVQTQLNQARTRLSSMDTDVAYSTINITLTEVVKYTNVSVTRTFGERLAATFGDSWESFLGFLEDVLFALIYLLPYAIVAGVIIAIVLAATKNTRARRKAEREERKARQREISFTDGSDPARKRPLWGARAGIKEEEKKEEEKKE